VTNVTRLPEPGIILDLDLEERDPKDIKPPFIVNVADRRITFEDPANIDWRDLASVMIPGDMLRVSLSRDDNLFLQKQALPAWKFNKLMEGYYLHYDLEDKIREAKRQANAFGI